MQPWLLNIAGILWSVLGLVWLISALAAKRVVRRQSVASRVIQASPVAAGFFLLFTHTTLPWWLSQALLPDSAPVLWIGLALTAAGIAFAIWARAWIGRNWSGTVTIKEQHELIQSGPYAWVRHPIYSGFLLAFVGTALIQGQLRGLLGFFLVLLGFTLKLRLEENFMAEQFGNAYSDYKKRVRALVPYVI